MTQLHNNPQPFDLNRALNGEPCYYATVQKPLSSSS